MTSRDFSTWVREQRISKGWTVSELAFRSGIGKAALYKIEKGHVGPSLWTAEQICSALQVHFQVG